MLDYDEYHRCPAVSDQWGNKRSRRRAVETVSGFTTTGASILSDVESMSHCALFWRSFTHWIGGMGVLVFVLAVLPFGGGNDIHLMLANEGRGGIAENLDSFEQNHTLYTVLNIRAGQVLDEVMKQKKEFFSLTTAARFIHNLLRILQRFHEHGLLHLDISPDNIFPAGNGRAGGDGRRTFAGF